MGGVVQGHAVGCVGKQLFCVGDDTLRSERTRLHNVHMKEVNSTLLTTSIYDQTNLSRDEPN